MKFLNFFIWHIFYWLTYLLIPSDEHNSRTAGAKDLISSLINVASSRFYQPQLLKCLHQGATFVPLDLPSFSSQPRKVTICGKHEMASVQHIKIDEALLMLCLAYHAMKRVRHCRNWDAVAFTYQGFTSIFSVFSVMAGWIAEILFLLLIAYIAV